MQRIIETLEQARKVIQHDINHCCCGSGGMEGGHFVKNYCPDCDERKKAVENLDLAIKFRKGQLF